MPSLTLNDFARLAAQTDASRLDTTFLKVRGDRLAETGRFGSFFTTQATRRATISAFVGTLRAQFGDRVADMINDDPALKNHMSAGKPLTARMVRNMTGLAQMEAIVNASVAVHIKNADALSTEDRAIVRGWARDSLLARAGKGGFHPERFVLEVPRRGVISSRNFIAQFSAAQGEAMKASNPGTLHDRLHLANMGLGKGDAVTFTRCLEKLETMRTLQPDGEILPETVHRALFGTPPEGLDGKALLASIEERCAAEKRAVVACARDKSTCEGYITCLSPFMPWEKIASLMLRPATITLADIATLTVTPGVSAGPSKDAVLRSLRGDPPRLHPADPVPTFSFRFDDARTESVEVGSKTGFMFADDADKEAYMGEQGMKDSSLARHLEALCTEFCGGENAPEAQLISAMSCLTQEHLLLLKLIAPLAGTTMDEHSNASVSLRRAEDGSGAILADFSSPPELDDSLGRFRMSLSIATDGAITMKEFELVPPLAARERNVFEEAVAGTVANVFGNMLRARGAGEARDQLDALGGYMRNTVPANDQGFAKKTPEEQTSVMERFMLLGAMQLVNKGDPRPFAAALQRPGPFRDMLHSLAGENGAPAEAARTTMQWFVKGMAGVLPDDVLQGCDGATIHERDLSLPLQRAILGADVYTARGAEAAMPALAGLNQSLARDMPAIHERIRAVAEDNLRRNSPEDMDAASGLYNVFVQDLGRLGLFVDGRFHTANPEDGAGTSKEDFIALFPDARTARLLSNLAAQSLHGIAENSLLLAASPETSQKLAAGYLLNTSLSGQDMSAQHNNVRIETLDASQGRYRIAGFKHRLTDNPASAESFRYEIAVDVNLGAPGAAEASSLPPSVENVRLDVLFRGREAGPDEA